MSAQPCSWALAALFVLVRTWSGQAEQVLRQEGADGAQLLRRDDGYRPGDTSAVLDAAGSSSLLRHEDLHEVKALQKSETPDLEFGSAGWEDDSWDGVQAHRRRFPPVFTGDASVTGDSNGGGDGDAGEGDEPLTGGGYQYGDAEGEDEGEIEYPGRLTGGGYPDGGAEGEDGEVEDPDVAGRRRRSRRRAPPPEERRRRSRRRAPPPEERRRRSRRRAAPPEERRRRSRRREERRRRSRRRAAPPEERRRRSRRREPPPEERRRRSRRRADPPEERRRRSHHHHHHHHHHHDSSTTTTTTRTTTATTTTTTEPYYGPNVRKGWCDPWQAGSSINSAGDMTGVSYFPSNWQNPPLQMQDCWDKCLGDDVCQQAVYRNRDGQCWLGVNTIDHDPGSAGFAEAGDCTESDCGDHCYAKNGFNYSITYVIRPGFCTPWREGFGTGGADKGDCREGDQEIEDVRRCSHWGAEFDLSEKGCYAKCNAQPHCEQAVYSSTTFDCWIGVDTIATDPGEGGWDSHCQNCQDQCYIRHGFQSTSVFR